MINKIKQIFTNKWFLLIIIWFIYVKSVECCSYHTHATQFLTEIPIILIVFSIFYYIQRNNKLRFIIPVYIILISYISIDFYYITYNTLLRISDIYELPALIKVMGIKFLFILLIFYILPLIILIININYKSIKTYAILVSVIIVYFIITINSDIITRITDKQIANDTRLSIKYAVVSYGRIYMILQRQIKSNYISKKYKNNFQIDYPINYTKDLEKHLKYKNINLIILESFLDVTKLNMVKYNISPEHPEFTKLLDDNKTISITSIFGGRSAQSEFEILCGVPALNLFGSIDFNMFNGQPAMCLPRFLNKLGYINVATNSYLPHYFNTARAYKSIGFDLTVFRKDYKKNQTYFLEPKDLVDNKMFDGELYNQNIKILKKISQKHPHIFSYVLGLYGHSDFERNLEKRPDVISDNSQNSQIHRIANQYYYRTKALAEYIKELKKIDKNSIIIIVSDHLPPLDKGKGEYERLGYYNDLNVSFDKRLYYNRMIVIDGNKVIKYDLVHHFNVPEIIFNLLTEGYYCKINKCHIDGKPYKKEDYLNKYLTIVTEGK